MEKKISSISILIYFFLFNSLLGYTPQAQEDCHQLLANAIKEFTQANFDGAIQILNSLKNQPSLYENCLLEERKNVLFYLSYCSYLLYGCSDKRTQQAVCDLKLHFPKFDPNEKEYQWVAQDWVSCWRNSNYSDCDLIINYYNIGKNLYSQNNYLSASQNLIYAKILMAPAKTAVLNCPDYEKYKTFAEEYLSICQEKLIDVWNNAFTAENYPECLKLEKQIGSIESYQDYLQKLNAHISEKKKELQEKISQKTWGRLETELENIFSITDFIAFNPDRFQEIWNEIKKYDPHSFDNEETRRLSIQNIHQEILNYYVLYGRYINGQFDIHQEEKVKQSLEDFKNFIISNFPTINDQIEKEYEKIINVPSPVFSPLDIGVKPPEKKWEWKITPPDCMAKTKISGFVRYKITINIQGQVENVGAMENKLEGDKNCAEQFANKLLNYIKDRKFIPAFKIKYRPARAPLPEKISNENINVKYSFEKKFVCKSEEG